MLKKAIAGLAIMAAASSANAALMDIQVDLELQLLADVSGSVSSTEYSLQLQGYEQAFRSANVHDAIMNGNIGSIAVQYIEWSSTSLQQVQVNWFEINSAASANAFADALAGVTRAFNNSTSIYGAIDFGVNQFVDNGFDSNRQVMDISGDGTSSASLTSTARDNALAAGIDTINGITIGTSPSLQNFYDANVIGGVGAFQINASTFADFTSGIERKLVREISVPKDVPTPSSLALLAIGLIGAGAAARKRRA